METNKNISQESQSTLLSDHILRQNIGEIVHQKTPERFTNAKGSGAYGKFTVTKDISDLTKAVLFSQVGNECRIFARFSGMFSEKGSADSARDLRGFALKFYTEVGNWDFVGNKLPVFFLKDPLKYPEFITAHSRDAKTNLRSTTKRWDFYSHHPETLHQLLMLFSDRGTPAGYRKMDGFGTHTYSLINREGKINWVKFHFKSQQGTEKFNGEKNIHSDFAQKDLTDSIESGNYPKWTLYIQVMSDDEARDLRWNPFDATKVWLHEDFPLMEIGELELNEIPDNYFSHVEQATFTPSNIIPGIGFSPDKMLQARLGSYAEAHRHRVGINAKELPVNRSQQTNNSQSFSAEVQQSLMADFAGYELEDDRYTQPGLFYTKALDDTGRENLVKNIISDMKDISGPERDAIINRQLCHFFRAKIELGMKIAMGLQVNIDTNMMTHTFSGS